MNISKLKPVSAVVNSKLDLKQWLTIPMLAASLTLAACGDSSSSDEEVLDNGQEQVVDSGNDDSNADQNTDNAEADSGALMIAITDAEEDFLSYTIGINSILLTKENGDQVEVLAESSQVDFVDYQELTELFSIVQAPIGKYTSIVMELDYSEAYILIQDEEGNTFEAEAVDSEGVVVSTHSVEFRLAEEETLEVTAKEISALTLDLDLSASNTILSYSPAQVEVQPFVIGDVSLDDEREHRLRGTLESVDSESQEITLNVKPMRKKQGQFGEFAIQLNDETSIELDGELVDLTTALSSLAEQDENFPLVAYGTVTKVDTDVEGETERVFTADSILAGSSVPWSGKDVFKGMITELAEGVAYLSGVSVDTDSMEKEQVKGYQLVLSDDTEFVSHLSDVVDASYMVPGQRVEILGQLSIENEVGQFDASGEVVRVKRSALQGEVTSVTDSGLLAVEVTRFNKRPHKVLKHKGHGNKPNRQEVGEVLVDASEFSQVSPTTGDWINIIGLVSPDSIVEGQNDVLASALTLYNVSETELTYTGVYGREGAELSYDQETAQISLDLTAGHHKMNFRFSKENQLADGDTLTLIAGEEIKHLALREKGEETIFFDTFAELADAVVAKQLEAETINAVAAKGVMNDDAQYVVNSLVIKLN